MRTSQTTTATTSKIAQQIYLRRVSGMSQILAKYADSGSVPTNLVNGGGIKPLTNQQQQPAQQPAQPPKQPETPQQPTQPAAQPIEPIPANVPPPPVVPPPSSGLPPATPMAPAATPSGPQPGTVSGTGQISGSPAGSPNAPPSENPFDDPPPQAQPAAPVSKNPAVSGAGNTAPTGNQPPPAQQPAAAPKPFTEQELAHFDQIQDPAQLQTELSKLTPEQQQQVAPRWVQNWANDPAHKEVIDGFRELYSGDPARANSPAAQQAKAFQQQLPQKLQQQLSQENFQKLMAAHPGASPQDQGGFMRQAWDQAGQSLQAMPWPAQLMMGLGLGAGLVGMFSSMFGEGGAESGLMGLLGIGAAGLIGANYGMFGNDARKMMGQGAVGMGRFFGMNIPEAKDFTPEGMKQKETDAQAAVMEAMAGNAEKKIPKGGWQGGIKKIEELRAPLDQLANLDRESAITALMGMMGTNDPSVASKQYDMLMQKRTTMMDPQYLRNTILGDPNADGAWARNMTFSGLEGLFGAYPGAAQPPQAK